MRGYGVDQDALCGEKPRMASLQDNDLALAGAQHRQIVGIDDSRCRYAIGEDSVGKLQNDLVARSQSIDVGEWCPECRAMPRDIDEPVLAGKTRPLISPRA